MIRPLAEDETCNDEEIRAAMLTLHRMDWLSTTYVRDPAANRRQTRRAVIDDQIAVFREQRTETQSLAIMIFEYIMDILSQLFGIQGKAQDFVREYCAHREARPTADSRMIDKHGIINFVKYVLVTHCIDLVFSMGVSSSLEMLQGKDINPTRKESVLHMECDILSVLNERMSKHIAGRSHAYQGLMTGRLLAEGLGYGPDGRWRRGGANVQETSLGPLT